MATNIFRRLVTIGCLGLVLLVTGAAVAGPSVAAPEQPCNDARVIWQSIPESTIMQPGQAFVVQWLVENTGTCIWTDKYYLVLDSANQLNSPYWQALPYGVWPGQSSYVSLQLAAPWTPGTYANSWHLVDESSYRFGPSLHVQLVVPAPAGSTELPSTLTYFPGGGGGQGCDAVPPRVQYPRMTPYSLAGSRRDVQICSYGLPANSVATATLIAPGGEKYSAPFYIGEPVRATDKQGGYRTTVLEIDLRLPVSLWVPPPNTVWRFSLDVGQVHLEEQLNIRPEWDASQVQHPGILLLSGRGWEQAFDTVARIGQWTHSYPAGDQVLFLGNGYLANSQIVLGIYRVQKTVATQVHELRTVASESGWFLQPYRLSLEPGEYWAVSSQEISGKRDSRSDILGLDNTIPFLVRATDDSPLLQITDVTPGVVKDTPPRRLEVSAINLGKTSSRGGTITVSSPDVSELKIVEADVPIDAWADCTPSGSVARVLTPSSRCSRAIQYFTDCWKADTLSYPLAEAWYQVWPTGARHTLKIAYTPKKGLSRVRLYVQAVAMVGSSGCQFEVAPDKGGADATDQQGFPLRLYTVPVP